MVGWPADGRGRKVDRKLVDPLNTNWNKTDVESELASNAHSFGTLLDKLSTVD